MYNFRLWGVLIQMYETAWPKIGHKELENFPVKISSRFEVLNRSTGSAVVGAY